jgi:hypothetical protein
MKARYLLFAEYGIVLALACGAALAAQSAMAQVNRCTNASGKVTYSDQPCDAGATTRSVTTHGNVVDGADDRMSAQRNKAQAIEERRSREIANLMRNPPKACKNTYFSLNDFTGWEKLEERSRRECVENILNEREGLPTSDVHQKAFRDHQRRMAGEVQKSGERDAAAKWRQQNLK